MGFRQHISEGEIFLGKEVAVSKERGRGRTRNAFSSVPQPEESKESCEQKGSDKNEMEPQKRIELSYSELPEKLRGCGSRVKKVKKTQQRSGERRVWCNSITTRDVADHFRGQQRMGE